MVTSISGLPIFIYALPEAQAPDLPAVGRCCSTAAALHPQTGTSKGAGHRALTRNALNAHAQPFFSRLPRSWPSLLGHGQASLAMAKPPWPWPSLLGHGQAFLAMANPPFCMANPLSVPPKRETDFSKLRLYPLLPVRVSPESLAHQLSLLEELDYHELHVQRSHLSPYRYTFAMWIKSPGSSIEPPFELRCHQSRQARQSFVSRSGELDQEDSASREDGTFRYARPQSYRCLIVCIDRATRFWPSRNGAPERNMWQWLAYTEHAIPLKFNDRWKP